MPILRLFAAIVLLTTGDASLSGVVLDDDTKAPVEGAQVEAPALGKRATTNERGEYRLSGLPAGTLRIEVRHIGHSLETLEVALGPNEQATRRIVLKKLVKLDSVVVNADVAAIPSFEENRKVGLGRFVTRADLAKRDISKLTEILRDLRGVNIIAQSGHGYLGSAKGQTSLMNQKCQKDLEGLPPAAPGRFDPYKGLRCACYAQVYLDEAMLYRGGDRDEVPDLNRFSPHQIEAIEYYASSSQTPLKYSKLNSECGVLVIHTRRSR